MTSDTCKMLEQILANGVRYSYTKVEKTVLRTSTVFIRSRAVTLASYRTCESVVEIA